MKMDLTYIQQEMIFTLEAGIYKKMELYLKKKVNFIIKNQISSFLYQNVPILISMKKRLSLKFDCLLTCIFKGFMGLMDQISGYSEAKLESSFS